MVKIHTKNCSTFKLVSGKKLPSILLFQQVPILPPDCCNSTKTMACLNQTSLGNNLTIANQRHGLGEWTLPLLSTLMLALVGDPTKDTVSYVNNKIILQNSALPVNTCSGPINFVLDNLTTTTDMLPLVHSESSLFRSTNAFHFQMAHLSLFLY